MTDWKTKLKEAKELLDLGLIDEAKYRDIQAKALQGMGLEDGPSVSNPRVPNQIGSYRLLGPIGQGGMGSVFRARHLTRIGEFIPGWHWGAAHEDK